MSRMSFERMDFQVFPRVHGITSPPNSQPRHGGGGRILGTRGVEFLSAKPSTLAGWKKTVDFTQPQKRMSRWKLING